MKKTSQIFLSYAHEDQKKVKTLYKKLVSFGFKPWMDQKNISPGEKWLSTIRQAIRVSDFFLACISSKSIDKKGVLRWEIKQALDLLQERPDTDIYLIPLRLENCKVPENLQKLQWLDYYKKDGFTLLVNTIREGLKRRNYRVFTSGLSQPLQARKPPSQTIQTAKSNAKSVIKTLSHKKLQAGQRTYKKSAGQNKAIALQNRIKGGIIANPNIWIEKDQMMVEIKSDKRIVKHEYLLRALKDGVNLYRFKVLWKGSGEVKVTRKSSKFSANDFLASFTDMSAIGWQQYVLIFAKPLKKGEKKLVILTHEIIDVKHGAVPFQAVSYGHVNGCENLSIHLAFFDPPYPDIINLVKCDKNWNDISREELPKKFEFTKDGARVYELEIKPEKDVKYRVQWQVAQSAANNNLAGK